MTRSLKFQHGGNKVKRIILTLCVFIALATVDNAAGFYRCVDRDGNTMLTDTPLPGAKCKDVGGSNESTPSKGQGTEAVNQEIDKQIRNDKTQQQREIEGKQATIKDPMLQQQAAPTSILPKTDSSAVVAPK
jgi:Domain of unknown function (DUF4124)